MARLRIEWATRTFIAPQAANTGETLGEEQGEQPQASLVRAERPMMIYVPADDSTDSAMRKLEDVVFANEKIGIGAKFFDTIRISAGDAQQDRILRETGDATPRIVFVQRDWSVSSVQEGKQISAGRLLKAMKASARDEYENNFEAMIRDYIKLLNELDRLEGKRTQLADSRARLADKPNAAKAKKLEREEKEFEEELAAWTQAEQKLLELRRKGEEPKEV